MQHPIDFAQLPEGARRALSGAANLKLMLARGMAPLPPVALVSALYGLAYDPEPALREAAGKTLADLPEPVLGGALASADLHPAVIDELAARMPTRSEVLQRLLRHAAVHNDTVVRVAKTCDEATSEQIAANEQRLIACPAVIEALYLNPATRMSTADRIVEFAARNGLRVAVPGFEQIVAALKLQLVPEVSAEALPSDAVFAEAMEHSHQTDGAVLLDEDDDGMITLAEQGKEVEKRLEDMNVTEKIRTAMLGNATQRAILIRSTNRLVAAAVLDSPKLGEDEVVKFAQSRSVSEELLRKIASKREFMRSYEVKSGLVFNPKTPVSESMRLLVHLREGDVKRLVGSKGIPSALKTAATSLISKRKK